jgi:hypothetical protein
MLTACCDNVQQVGRCPFLHNKDHIVKNLHLLFANVPEVTVDDYHSLKNWVRKASNEQYWANLIECLLHRQAPIPPRLDEWPQPRQSPQNHYAPPQNQQPFAPKPPQTQCTQQTEPPTTPDPKNHQHQLAPSPSPPRPLPPRRQQPVPLPPPQADGGHDYIPEKVGCSIYDSMKILGLGLGASERKVKLAFRRLACLYHPDKWEQARTTTGMMLQETTAHFQLFNNAHAFLPATL